MGCCQTCKRENPSVTSDCGKIIQAINLGSKRRLEGLLYFFKTVSSVEAFDSLKIPYDSLTFNTMSLCFYLGKADLFQVVLNFGCNLGLMEDILEKQGISPIDWLSSKGYIEVLKVYFPLFLTRSSKKNMKSFSVKTTHCSTETEKTYAIHKAACNGHIAIINYFYEYFFEFASKPAEYDIDTIEESTGENCALIACREGHFSLVKFLHEKCKADFFLLNESKENALMVTLAGMKRSGSYSYIDIVEFLVENVKIDVRYMYEETLIIVQTPCLVDYLEKKLKGLGINVSKAEIERTIPKALKSDQTDEPETTQKIFTDTFMENLEKKPTQSVFSTISACPESLDDEKIYDSLLPQILSLS